MALKYPNLFKPIYIGNVETKNRIVHVPTDISSGNADGSTNERTIYYHEEVAKAGVGLIICGATTPESITGRPTVTCLIADNDNYIPGLHRLARSMQRHGAKCAVQIQHPGRQAAMPRTGQISCSDLVTDQPGSAGHEVVYAEIEKKGKVARAMTVEEIYDLIEKYGEAAWRVQQAGFDCVELHAAHGYLIAQFMSPHTNRRTDRFGGSFENRMRFPLEIVARIKRKCGKDFPVLYRYSAEEFVPEGRKLDESIRIAKALEENGVAALDISAGTFDAPGPVMDPMYYPEGWNTYTAEAIKKEVSIPVITSHSLRSPEYCDRIIAEGKTDMVGLSRQFVADPYWALKAYYGKEKEIRKCISCLVGCWQESLMIKHEIKCAINPAMGDERFWNMQEAKKPMKIAVVGGGAAGMEASRIATIRGHKVTLYSKESELGGAMKYCCMVPGKAKMRWYLDWIREQVKKLNVGTHLKTEPKLDELRSYDVMLVGTGAHSFRPEIPGIDKAIGFEEVMVCDRFDCPWHPGDRPGPVQTGHRVLVWGEHYAGADTAEALAFTGKEVTIVTHNKDFVPSLEPVHRDVLMKRLAGGNGEGLTGKTIPIPVRILANSTVYRISDGEVTIENTEFERQTLEIDSVILAYERPVNDLYKKLLEEGMMVANMGDSVEPKNLRHAVRDGANYGLIIDEGIYMNANRQLCHGPPLDVATLREKV